jgi:hypothetical protein
MDDAFDYVMKNKGIECEGALRSFFPFLFARQA